MKSPIFTKIFRYYVWYLFYRRFSKVWLDQGYYPEPFQSSVYYLNHNSWWDGIIPLLLNEFRFRQNAMAIMDERQIKKHPFFRKIGAYSIDRSNPKEALKTLQFTVDLLQKERTSVFIYPQGHIIDPCEPIAFEGGLSWLYTHCENVDFVPIALHQHTFNSDKPELFIKSGKPANFSRNLHKKELIRGFEHSLTDLVNTLRQESAITRPFAD